ncbi:MAG: hypothetical protein J6V25_04440 [Oscillospiraceae bacterium]|nr:hypothetical protein [Oscillospiraceae bacterium]
MLFAEIGSGFQCFQKGFEDFFFCQKSGFYSIVQIGEGAEGADAFPELLQLSLPMGTAESTMLEMIISLLETLHIV